MTDKGIFHSPVISEFNSLDKRLIDTGMLHYESSVAGYNERYHRGQTSHTIHVWWARRPHSAMRSLIFSSLCKRQDDYTVDLMARLAMNCRENDINDAKEIISTEYYEAPKILDMFGGGGTIPFEAKRLGLDTYSIDSNQLSVFIQRCNMSYADNIDLKEAEQIIEFTGKKILSILTKQTEWLYPLRKTTDRQTFGYVWTYKTSCLYCHKSFYLTKRPWLSKKNGRRIAFVNELPADNQDEKLKIYDLSRGGEPYISAWEKGTGILHCPKCGRKLEKPDVLSCKDALVATISKQKTVGKFYSSVVQGDAIPETEFIHAEEQKILEKIDGHLPSSKLPVWSGVVNPALYGIKTHSDFLNCRQRLVLLYLIYDLIREFNELSKDNVNMAKFVVGALSSLIDQVIDWNCRLSMWIPQNEQVGRAFCGPGIAMLFDYAETDMLLDGPANLWDKLKRIINGISSFENCKGKVHIYHAHAQNLPFKDEFFDAIVTDPPYYDNIYYSILADFFYSWKKMLLKKIEPDLFERETTDSKYELVASSRRVERGKKPHEEYCEQLEQAISEASRVLKKNGIFSFVYSHSSVNAWAAVVSAYRKSKFVVTSVQPLSIERKGRPRAVMSKAVNTCVTFVARKSHIKKETISLSNLLRKTEEFSQSFGKQLMEKSGWCENDAGLAVIACTVGLLSNASKINGAESDQAALIEAANVVKKYFPAFSMKIRDSI